MSELIGDRVRLIVDLPRGISSANVTGKIVVVQSENKHPGKLIGVELDEKFKGIGHQCDGAAAPGRGWWTRPENIEVV
ncbi:hypothetical protein LCGC14_0856490 [marine sediment metagenome]|uniref:KOW domain-containing protein n=1 Tax=marine sediment metagenome TaxID=412755 RepID=A0A0F9PDK9_9ZZZZ